MIENSLAGYVRCIDGNGNNDVNSGSEGNGDNGGNRGNCGNGGGSTVEPEVLEPDHVLPQVLRLVRQLVPLPVPQLPQLQYRCSSPAVSPAASPAAFAESNPAGPSPGGSPAGSSPAAINLPVDYPPLCISEIGCLALRAANDTGSKEA